MRVHAIATQGQFWRHIAPVFQALPDDMQGDVMLGRDAHHPRVRRYPHDDVFIVAAAGSIPACCDRRVIYVEHGAGQTYSGLKPRHAQHYPRGVHPPNVIGYICPNETVARSWHGRPAVVVGCPAIARVTASREPSRVVFTFHWDAPAVCPEARSARPHYLDHLHEMTQWARDTGFDDVQPLGHWHPRDRYAERIWRSLGVDTEPDPDVALGQACLLIADNTSLLYEAAALGIATVVLNAPWYRRDVDHGLRFWEHPPGPMVDDAYELMRRPVMDWIVDPAGREIAKAAEERAYGWGDADTGAQFIVDLVT